MKTATLNRGFSALMVIIVILAIGIVGFSVYKGYEVMQANNEVNKAAELQPAVADDVPAAVEVVSTSDLDEATAILNQMSEEATNADTLLLDSEMENF